MRGVVSVIMMLAGFAVLSCAQDTVPTPPALFATSTTTKPILHHLKVSADPSYCLVSIVGKYARCFVDRDSATLPKPDGSKWSVFIIYTDEDVSEEAASGILLAAQILYPNLLLMSPEPAKP